MLEREKVIVNEGDIGHQAGQVVQLWLMLKFVSNKESIIVFPLLQ